MASSNTPENSQNNAQAMEMMATMMAQIQDMKKSIENLSKDNAALRNQVNTTHPETGQRQGNEG